MRLELIHLYRIDSKRTPPREARNPPTPFVLRTIAAFSGSIWEKSSTRKTQRLKLILNDRAAKTEALLDPGIRPALRALNRVTGVATRSSCQGKWALGERSTHADLAYVLFRDPIPLAVEGSLLESIEDVARVDAQSVYSRWPDRNREVCVRLAAVAR